MRSGEVLNGVRGRQSWCLKSVAAAGGGGFYEDGARTMSLKKKALYDGRCRPSEVACFHEEASPRMKRCAAVAGEAQEARQLLVCC